MFKNVQFYYDLLNLSGFNVHFDQSVVVLVAFIGMINAVMVR